MSDNKNHKNNKNKQDAARKNKLWVKYFESDLAKRMHVINSDFSLADVKDDHFLQVGKVTFDLFASNGNPLGLTLVNLTPLKAEELNFMFNSIICLLVSNKFLSINEVRNKLKIPLIITTTDFNPFGGLDRIDTNNLIDGLTDSNRIFYRFQPDYVNLIHINLSQFNYTNLSSCFNKGSLNKNKLVVLYIVLIKFITKYFDISIPECCVMPYFTHVNELKGVNEVVINNNHFSYGFKEIVLCCPDLINNTVNSNSSNLFNYICFVFNLSKDFTYLLRTVDHLNDALCLFNALSYDYKLNQDYFNKIECLKIRLNLPIKGVNNSTVVRNQITDSIILINNHITRFSKYIFILSDLFKEMRSMDDIIDNIFNESDLAQYKAMYSLVPLSESEKSFNSDDYFNKRLVLRKSPAFLIVKSIFSNFV